MPLTAAPPRAAPAQTVIAELVGPAGVGKTALLRAVAQHDAEILAGAHIDRWRDLPTVIGQAIALIPIGLELLRTHPRSFRAALAQLLRLRTLPFVLGREARAGRAAVVLDEGPLFALGRLSVFQGANRGVTRLAREWRAQLDDWAGRLDIVIWLDAPDALLAERIRARPKAHRIKTATDAAIMEFLDRYRRAYEDIRARVVACGHARVIDVDTGAVSVAQAVPGVLAAVHPRRDA